MREGISDRIVKEIKRLDNLSRQKIRLWTKGEKPFASVEMPAEDLIWASEHLGYMDLADLIGEFGYEAVNKQLFEINKLKRRRGLDKK